MNPSKQKPAFILGGFALTVGLVAVTFATYLKQNQSTPQENQSVLSRSNLDFDLPSETNSHVEASNAPSRAGQSANQGLDSIADANLKSWFRSQMTALDSTNLSQAETEKETRARIENMSARDWDQMKSIALSPSSAAQARILATHMLAQGGARSLSQLSEFVNSEIPRSEHLDADKDGRHASAAETEAMRERALRVMAIDSLGVQAAADLSNGRSRADSPAYLSLQSVAHSAPDEFLRRQAQVRLNRIH